MKSGQDEIEASSAPLIEHLIELRRRVVIAIIALLVGMVDSLGRAYLPQIMQMMLPPSVVSLRFKLIFFVLVDGWRLISASLVQGFVGL